METPISTPALPTLDGARRLAARSRRALLAGALGRAREITSTGAAIEEHQVVAERVAYAATEVGIARELVEERRRFERGFARE